MKKGALKYKFKVIKGLSSIKEEVDRTIFEMNPYIHETELFSLKLVITEMLNNAVIHGHNSSVSHVSGCVFLDVKTGELEIDVEDKGEGFDWKELIVDTRTAPDPDETLKENGRGYMLARLYGYSYSFNEKGNKVKLIKSVKLNDE